jgi:hypothetical protein
MEPRSSAAVAPFYFPSFLFLSFLLHAPSDESNGDGDNPRLPEEQGGGAAAELLAGAHARPRLSAPPSRGLATVPLFFPRAGEAAAGPSSRTAASTTADGSGVGR